MGEDLEAEGRMAVGIDAIGGRSERWFFDRSPASPDPAAVSDAYGPDAVNVGDQKRDPHSLWSFMRTLIQTYRDCPELGWGEFRVLRQPRRRSWHISAPGRARPPLLSTTCRHTRSPRSFELETEQPVWLDDLLAHESIQSGPRGTAEVGLEGYGHRWLRVASETVAR